MLEDHLLCNSLDVNECSLTRQLHDCDQICVNTIGGFNCTCEEGYLSQDDGRNCSGSYANMQVIHNTYLPNVLFVDINECDQDLCDVESVCFNMPGSFQCICNPGFTGDELNCRGSYVNLLVLDRIF